MKYFIFFIISAFALFAEESNTSQRLYVVVWELNDSKDAYKAKVDRWIKGGGDGNEGLLMAIHVDSIKKRTITISSGDDELSATTALPPGKVYVLVFDNGNPKGLPRIIPFSGYDDPLYNDIVTPYLQTEEK